jgi:hypothetical protein
MPGAHNNNPRPSPAARRQPRLRTGGGGMDVLDGSVMLRSGGSVPMRPRHCQSAFDPNGTRDSRRFMGSLLSRSRTPWDHEPADWSADLLIGLWSLANVNLPNWSSAFRFMEVQERGQPCPRGSSAGSARTRRSALRKTVHGASALYSHRRATRKKLDADCSPPVTTWLRPSPVMLVSTSQAASERFVFQRTS